MINIEEKSSKEAMMAYTCSYSMTPFDRFDDDVALDPYPFLDTGSLQRNRVSASSPPRHPIPTVMYRSCDTRYGARFGLVQFRPPPSFKFHATELVLIVNVSGDELISLSLRLRALRLCVSRT